MTPDDSPALNTPVWVLKTAPGFWGGWTADGRVRVGLALPTLPQEAIVPAGWVTPRA